MHALMLPHPLARKLSQFLFLSVAPAALWILPLHPAQAQVNENRVMMERMERMERELMLLQRQIARGGAGTATVVGEDASGYGALEVKLAQFEEEMSNLRGQAEENAHRVKQLTERLERLQSDLEYRLNALESGASQPKPVETPEPETPKSSPSASEGSPPPGTIESSEGVEIDASESGETGADRKPLNRGPSSAGDGVLRPSTPPQAGSGGNLEFDQPRDHYNYAFKMLNQTRYDEAARYFESFVAKYPKDPLVGNAFYWLGETYYIRRDYVKAADQFRQGFEALPSGPKAADNLLKLAQSLNAMKQNKDACVVLEQLLAKFRNDSTAITQKAQKERTRIGCK